jgi:hemolysin III
MPPPDLSSDIRRQIALDPPRFRGLLHLWCIPISIVASVVAMSMAPAILPRVLVGIYGFGLVSMFSFSALFHRGRWSDHGWWRMRQLDHTGIYLVIAGSFTGIAGLSLDGGARIGLLIAVWIVAAAGIAYRWLPVVPPFGATTAIFVVIAAMVVPFLGRLGSALGVGGVILLVVGCVIYFIGALALGARVPDPAPAVFGYHEVWHIVVVVGSTLHYAVLVGYAIPFAQQAATAGAL